MTRTAHVLAQAKVNLRLRVLAREASGHHQIETLFLRLDLADEVRVRLTPGERSLDVGGDVDGAALGPVERNLAWRAAAAHAAASGHGGGWAIELVKRIPVGGGLGGGSADAAAVLRAMDALVPAPLGDAALVSLAAPLGADVSFLASRYVYALAWGRGERMLGLPALAAREVVLVIPPFGVNTAEAYGWVARAREDGVLPSASAGSLALEALGEWDRVAELATNDFEPVVAARHPMIAELTQALRSAGLPVAMMSGSGSTVFGVTAEGASVPALPAVGALAGVRTARTRTASRVEPVRLLD